MVIHCFKRTVTSLHLCENPGKAYIVAVKDFKTKTESYMPIGLQVKTTVALLI